MHYSRPLADLFRNNAYAISSIRALIEACVRLAFELNHDGSRRTERGARIPKKLRVQTSSVTIFSGLAQTELLKIE